MNIPYLVEYPLYNQLWLRVARQGFDPPQSGRWRARGSWSPGSSRRSYPSLLPGRAQRAKALGITTFWVKFMMFLGIFLWNFLMLLGKIWAKSCKIHENNPCLMMSCLFSPTILRSAWSSPRKNSGFTAHWSDMFWSCWLGCMANLRYPGKKILS